MKQYSVGLQNSVSAIYDKTKTYMAGTITQKTLPAPFNTSTVLSAPLSKFIDVYTDTSPVLAVLPSQMAYTSNDRLFILQSALTTGLVNTLLLYNFNSVTGAYSYVGKIKFSIGSPATPTAVGLGVDDSDTSNIKIFIGLKDTTATTGGCLFINKVTLADFTSFGAQIYTAQSDDVQGVYLLKSPFEVGGANLLTSVTGLVMPGTRSSNPDINTKIYLHNGVTATHQYYVFDYATAPTLVPMGTTTVTAPNTTGASTTFTMVGNTLAVNDPVIITSNPPTAYTASTVNTAQTVYYVVATNFVSGSTFSLSATLGGAILAATSAVGTTTFARALGETNNLFVAKTANLPAAGAGTMLIGNNENFCVPSSTALANTDCLFFATSTNLYLGKLSEVFVTHSATTSGTTMTSLSGSTDITNGMTVFGPGITPGTTVFSHSGNTIVLSLAVTTPQGSAVTFTFGASAFPSLTGVNVLGSGVDYVLPLPLLAAYSSSIDKAVFSVAGSKVLVKPFANNTIVGDFGNANNDYMEIQNHITDPLQLQAFNSMECSNGWLFMSSSATIGQRGIIALNLRSDDVFDYSYITSPVIHTPGFQTLIGASTVEQLYDYTSATAIYYKTANTDSDVIFTDPSVGWTELSNAVINNIALDNFTQFKVSSVMISGPDEQFTSLATPAQIIDLQYVTALIAEISDYWDYSYNDSSSAIPTRIGFALRTAYPLAVPKLYFRAYDTAGTLITTADTVTNASNFQYSADDGLTWLPLGTIPNVAGTRIRYTFTTPPGVDVRVGLMES